MRSPHRFESPPDGLSARENDVFRGPIYRVAVIRSCSRLYRQKKRILVSFRATKKKIPKRFKWKTWCARCLPILEQIFKLHRLVRESLEGYCHTLRYTCRVSSGTVAKRTSRILPLVLYPFYCIAWIVTYPLPVLHRSSNWISELYYIRGVAREEVTL